MSVIFSRRERERRPDFSGAAYRRLPCACKVSMRYKRDPRALREALEGEQASPVEQSKVSRYSAAAGMLVSMNRSGSVLSDRPNAGSER